MTLLPMDFACLEYLVEHGDNGSMPTIAIPIRLFRGEIPVGVPDLVELGLIEHTADRTAITLLGRMHLPATACGGDQ
jgi:hypothetical protein